MEINGKLIEELGYKTSEMGGKEWQKLTNLLRKTKEISFNEAAEIAFRELL
jgi:hypothetical protein